LATQEIYPPMTEPNVLEEASRRLSQALDALEGAVERRREADQGEEAMGAQIQALGIDRAKLAADLDAVTAHSRVLEETNREVARRLDLAMENVRSVIAAHER
jgi:hypothetical protein